MLLGGCLLHASRDMKIVELHSLASVSSVDGSWYLSFFVCSHSVFRGLKRFLQHILASWLEPWVCTMLTALKCSTLLRSPIFTAVSLYNRLLTDPLATYTMKMYYFWLCNELAVNCTKVFRNTPGLSKGLLDLASFFFWLRAINVYMFIAVTLVSRMYSKPNWSVTYIYLFSLMLCTELIVFTQSS